MNTILESKFNTSNFVKQWATTNLFSSLDSYIGSGHNYYMYHDTITNKFEWIGWDNNEAFGSFKNGLNSTQIQNLDMYYISTPTTSRPLCNNMLLNATYKTAYNDAYCELLNDFSNMYFDPKIDSLDNLIRASVYADPKKTTTNTQYDQNINNSVTTTGPGGLEVFGLKSFINSRRTSAIASLSTHGVNCSNSITNTTESNIITIYPNPSSNFIRIESTELINEIILLTDALGNSIGKFNADNKNEILIDMSNYSSGMYYILVGSKNYKIIKM